MPNPSLTAASYKAFINLSSPKAFANSHRSVSTISAIRQGIGKTKLRSLQPRFNRPQESRAEARPEGDRFRRPQREVAERRPWESEGRRRDNPESNRRRVQGREWTSPTERRAIREPAQPVVIPYSSPASEFLFGRSVVESALKAQRRTLYKLYYDAGRGTEATHDAGSETLRSTARRRGVELCPLHGGESQRLLDKMSKGRPHNGYILEASPLSKLPVTALLSSDPTSGTLGLALGHQSPEEQALNGVNPVLPYHARQSRHPFLLFLDGIVDPGNLGAILRSAFFLGVDAVVMSSHCASLSPVVLKASAGAAEVLPLLTVHNTGAFIETSRSSGWKFFAAVPSETQLKHRRKPVRTAATLGSPLDEQPCVLMLGGEGPGLWQDLIQRADALLTIEGRRSGEAGVDSLNVSVAAALACHAFMAGATSKTNDLWG